MAFTMSVINSEITYNKGWEQAEVALTIEEGPVYGVAFSETEPFWIVG